MYYIWKSIMITSNIYKLVLKWWQIYFILVKLNFLCYVEYFCEIAIHALCPCFHWCFCFLLFHKSFPFSLTDSCIQRIFILAPTLGQFYKLCFTDYDIFCFHLLSCFVHNYFDVQIILIFRYLKPINVLLWLLTLVLKGLA